MTYDIGADKYILFSNIWRSAVGKCMYISDAVENMERGINKNDEVVKRGYRYTNKEIHDYIKIFLLETLWSKSHSKYVYKEDMIRRFKSDVNSYSKYRYTKKEINDFISGRI